jgi:hypothetical protein
VTALQSSQRIGPYRRTTLLVLVATMIAIVVTVVLALSLTLSGASHGRPSPRTQPTLSYSTAGHQGVAIPSERGEPGSGTRTMLPSAQPDRCTTANCRNRR